MLILAAVHCRGLVVLRAIVRILDLGLRVECPPRESFLWILARIHASIGETTENSKQLGRQARLGVETLHVLSTSFEGTGGTVVHCK